LIFGRGGGRIFCKFSLNPLKTGKLRFFPKKF